MATARKLGVWMDYSRSYLMELTFNSIETSFIECEFNHRGGNEYNSNNFKNLFHTAEYNQNTEYFLELGEAINNYDEVILFGPAYAKIELFNLLIKDHRFENTKITIKQIIGMTEDQQHLYLREYFSKS